MSRRPTVVALVLTFLAAAPLDASAQRRAGAHLGARAPEVAGSRAPDGSRPPVLSVRALPLAPAQRDAPVPVFAPGRPASAAPYVAGGALVGAVAVAGAIAYYFQAHPGEECICGPVTFAPVVLGGAVVGAVAGAVVYTVRRR